MIFKVIPIEVIGIQGIEQRMYIFCSFGWRSRWKGIGKVCSEQIMILIAGYLEFQQEKLRG